MNINLTTGSGSHPIEPDDCDIQGEIDEHLEIMNRSGQWEFTGEVALITEPDPGYPGSYRVWAKTEAQIWVYVDPDGVAIEAACPIGD